MSFQNKPTSVTSYDLAALFLHTRGKPVPRKKLANNTYVERRNDSTIAVRLHNTDVVTFHEHSPYRPGASGIRAVTLSTGGWLTVTTKDRINTVLAWPMRVYSERGTWAVTLEGWQNTDNAVRFTDGITFEALHGDMRPVERTLLPGEDQARQDRHNTSTKRLINRYVTRLTDERLQAALSFGQNPDACVMCRPHTRIPHDKAPDRERIITVGDAMEDTEHLLEHLQEGVYPFQLLFAAVAERGYIAENVVGHRDTVKRTLRTYLASRLYLGATAHQHGKRPILTAA